jgi:hypothetical protein
MEDELRVHSFVTDGHNRQAERTKQYKSTEGVRYYTNIPCGCGQYTRIFSRGKTFLYIDHSHIEYLLYYILTVK